MWKKIYPNFLSSSKSFIDPLCGDHPRSIFGVRTNLCPTGDIRIKWVLKVSIVLFGMKRGNNTPKRKRLKRHARLVQAKTWFSSYTGKNPIKGYAKWFGVDWLCALTELKLSGISFAPESEQKIIEYHTIRELKIKESKNSLEI